MMYVALGYCLMAILWALDVRLMLASTAILMVWAIWHRAHYGFWPNDDKG